MKQRLPVAMACALPCGVHEDMRKLGRSKAAPDFELALDAMAAAKRKLADCCAEAYR